MNKPWPLNFVKILFFTMFLVFPAIIFSQADDVLYPDLIVKKPNKQIRCKIINNDNSYIHFVYLAGADEKRDSLSYFRVADFKQNYFTEPFIPEKISADTLKIKIRHFFGVHGEFQANAGEMEFPASFYPERQNVDSLGRTNTEMGRFISPGLIYSLYVNKHVGIKLGGFYRKKVYTSSGSYFNQDSVVANQIIYKEVDFEDRITTKYVKTELTVDFSSDINKDYFGYVGIGLSQNFLYFAETRTLSTRYDYSKTGELNSFVLGGMFSLGGMYRYNDLLLNLNLTFEKGISPVFSSGDRSSNFYIFLNGGIKFELFN